MLRAARLYAEGKPLDALRSVFPSPDFCLDHLEHPEVPESHPLLSFLHAMAFGHQLDALISGRYLEHKLSPALKSLPGFQEQLREDITLLQLHCLQGPPLEQYLNHGSLEGAGGNKAWIRNPALLEAVLLEKQRQAKPPFSSAVQEFEDLQSSFFRHVRDQIIYLSRPYLPFSYPKNPNYSASIAALNPGDCLYLEPFDGPWEKDADAISEKQLILCFLSEAHLYLCLQFEPLRRLICSRKHLLLLPQLYPNEQLRKQPAALRLLPNSPRPLDPFAEALAEVLASDRGELRTDNPVADRCYQIGKELHYNIRAQQLGSSRFFALHASRHNIDWSAPHKGQDPQLQERYTHAWDARMEESISLFAQPPKTRRNPHSSILKLAHIVPQVVEGGHSPTKLLKLLMQHHNRTLFEPHLFVTERLVLRASEYPVNGYASPSSLERGKESLVQIRSWDIPVYVEDAKLSIPETAQRLCQHLESLDIDIAIFHGPDAINLVSARGCDCPLKVFFEHGTLPKHPGFDLVIASTEDAVQRYGAWYQGIGSTLVAHPFVLDLRHGWTEHPPSKADLGVPEDARILTTISNHLEARLSSEMPKAVALILQRIPNAWYCPMGPVKNPERLLAYFEQQGVAQRVRFLGTQAHPGQLARAMDLYLNEFPFGSCISMLEAMAAGCPPITMYDPNGPVQARYGGDYFGIDYAITSLKTEDYVERTCEVLKNQALYDAWSLRALEISNSRCNPASYVQALETEILNHLALPCS